MSVDFSNNSLSEKRDNQIQVTRQACFAIGQYWLAYGRYLSFCSHGKTDFIQVYLMMKTKQVRLAQGTHAWTQPAVQL
jgi:hypothetical protein